MSEAGVAEPDGRGKPNRWYAPLLGVVALLALYLVIFVLPRPELTLQYLKALAWPAVVASFLYWTREPLKTKVEQLLSLGAFGAEARFAATERLQQNVTGPAAAVLATAGEDDAESEGRGEQLGEGVSGGPSSAGDGDHRSTRTTGSDEPGVSDVEGDRGVVLTRSADRVMRRARDERHRREREQEAVEKIIQESAAWGYEMAHLGFKTVPVPAIEWTNDGRPIIKYGSGSGSDATSRTRHNRIEAARRLEDEIRMVQARVDDRDLTDQFTNAGSADRRHLELMKQRLKRLDPNSPLAE